MRLFNGVHTLDRPSLANTLRLDLSCIPLIAQMNRNGLLIDPAEFHRQSYALSDKLAHLNEDITLLLGRELNPLSGDQVAELCFDELQLEPIGGKVKLTKSKKRPSTEGDILEGMRGQHPIVDLVLDYREAAKLKSTYTDALPLLMWPDGRVRTTLKNTTARTGRLASEFPNLQNIPAKTDDGMLVRHGFIAPRRRKLVSLDLAQIEMVTTAHLSQDSGLMRIFQEKLDIHTATAAAIWRISMEQVDRLKHRLPAKTISFGVLYGVTAEGLQLQILLAGGPLWTREECQKLIDDWFRVYPGVRQYMYRQAIRARRYGMVWDMFGRPNYMAEVKSALRWVAEAGIRKCGNHGPQASAAGVLKMNMAALIPVVEYFNSFPSEECLPCLQVHDEVIFECTNPIVDEFMGIAKEIMETTVPLSIPVRSSAMAGEHWGQLK